MRYAATLLVCLLLSTCAAWADKSWEYEFRPDASVGGPSGLVAIPNAFTVPAHSVAAFVNRINAGVDYWTSGVNIGGRANLGMAEPLGVEFGITAIDPETPAKETIANFKVGGNSGKWALGAGAIDLTDQTNRTLYFVATRRVGCLDSPGGLSLGFGSNDTNKNLDGLFLGLDAGIVTLEHDAEETNLGVRLGPLRLGWISGDFYSGLVMRTQF